ncbi:type II toxin-antitoxin system VapC family toxin [Mucilaginibacter glaciei]|uniref:PIN domain-containing protein n=1 Tax=Mucilaginibacter glaciei TaxID=2772109 RepID=A0A926NQQ5_9SPHI|nr:PIN domain-containing protein [Mucilaginibacter glaciei]MBD1392960.1 PIN domain-containing protein [Mucilaginibacter glaciei]
MAYRIFLDANILIDYALKRDDYEDAEEIVEMVQKGYVEGFITSSVLHIIGYWISKAYGAEKTKELLLVLLTDVVVIDITHDIALLALHSKIDDVEDALQYYTAIHHKLDYFVTRDKQLQKNGIPALQVIGPKEFINRL